MHSNLDTDEHTCDERCPCLPAVWVVGHTEDGEAVANVYHDAPVARVRRSEGGHP